MTIAKHVKKIIYWTEILAKKKNLICSLFSISKIIWIFTIMNENIDYTEITENDRLFF